MFRPSHLRRAIFGPSVWHVYSGGLNGPQVSHGTGRQTANGLSRYITAHGPSLIRHLIAARAIFGPARICKCLYSYHAGIYLPLISALHHLHISMEPFIVIIIDIARIG